MAFPVAAAAIMTGGSILGGMLNKPETSSMSTLTPEQRRYFNQYMSGVGQHQQGTWDQLSQLGANPRSAYSAIPNWEQEFQRGVVDPSRQMMQDQLAGVQHTSERHSSARKFQEQNVMRDYANRLAQMRYGQLNTERGLQMQGMENAYGRQQQALGTMQSAFTAPLGVRGRENIVSQGSNPFTDAIVPGLMAYQMFNQGGGYGGNVGTGGYSNVPGSSGNSGYY